MGIGEVNGFGYYAAARDSIAYGLDANQRFWQSQMRFQPSAYWNHKIALNTMNAYTYSVGQPWAFSFNLMGPKGYRQPYYNVLDSREVSYDLALRLQGYRPDYTAACQADTQRIIDNGNLSALTNRIGSACATLKSIGNWEKAKELGTESENTELRSRAKALASKAIAYETQMNELLENGKDSSVSELISALKVIQDSVSELKTEADELLKELKEAAKAVAEEKAEKAAADAEAAAAAAEEAANSAAADAGSASGNDVEGDSELTESVAKKNYGMSNKASIPVCDNASELATKAMTAVGRNNDDTNKNEFDNLFGDGSASKLGSVTPQNVIEVLGSISDMDAFVSGIQDQDAGDDKNSMSRIVTLISKRLSTLVEAGHLTTADEKYTNVKDELSSINSNLANFGSKIGDIATSLTTIVTTLKGVGTKADVDAKIKAKQEAAIATAKTDFRKGYAASTTGSENPKVYDENKTYKTFPEEITYLPNKKMYQAKIDGKTFTGKDFAEINKKVMKSADETIVEKWLEIKKELLEEQSA